jgi:beta-lysine N6-acetyltransferase
MKDITEGTKMQDKFEIFRKSKIQHGKFNNRIYLMKLSPDDVPEIIPELNELAAEQGYTKIFAKIQASELPHFILNGYVMEAFVPKFYKNKFDCIMVSLFLDKKRQQAPAEKLKNFYELQHATARSLQLKYKHSLKYVIKKLGTNDIESITGIFKRVFTTYPFPIHDPNYIVKTMQKDDTQYFGIRDNKKLIGVSTAEIDLNNKNAEMTDFAVLPEYRGQNLAFRLLVNMEQQMKITNIKTVYTISRLNEPGMNKTFLKSGYKYTGTLINNTNIGGSIESMNIFYKHL